MPAWNAGRRGSSSDRLGLSAVKNARNSGNTSSTGLVDAVRVFGEQPGATRGKAEPVVAGRCNRVGAPEKQRRVFEPAAQVALRLRKRLMRRGEVRMQSGHRVVETGWGLVCCTQYCQHEIGLMQQDRLVVLHADPSLAYVVAPAYQGPAQAGLASHGPAANSRMDHGGCKHERLVCGRN